MLGLGDIVIPGIFIALLLRFDLRYVALLCQDWEILLYLESLLLCFSDLT